MCMITQSSATTGIESLNNVNMSILQLSKEINELFCNLTPHAAHYFPYLIYFFSSLIALLRWNQFVIPTGLQMYFSHTRHQEELPTLIFSQSNCFNDMCVHLELANISFISLLLSDEKWWKTFTTLSSKIFFAAFYVNFIFRQMMEYLIIFFFRC